MSLPPFPPDYRASGVLLHVTSLPSRYGIGDVGAAALAWIDHLHEAGQSWWQVLPLGPTGYGDSPYQSLSSFAGNELLVSPDWLIEDGLLRVSDCEGAGFSPDAVDYDAVAPFKHRLLETAWTNFHAGARPDLRPAYMQFCQDHAHWLEDYALFRALKSRHGGAHYLDWPVELTRRAPGALTQARRELARQIDQVRLAQFLLFRQGARLKQHARARGVRLIGDLPFFVSPDSSDVWANPELFLLDEHHRPRVVAGVPPDYFSATGQLWGNPIYRWDEMAARGFGWWVDRFRATFEMMDRVRLDHFRGFEAYWEIPAGEKTAVNGKWVKGPGAALFEALHQALGDLPIVAENLGVITPEVEMLREHFGFPGMAILQFAWGSDPQGSTFIPHNYPRKLVVYTGTHDNDTTVGWWTSGVGDSTRSLADVERERDFARRYMNTDGKEIHWDFIRTLLGSVAELAIVPLQDVLGLGSEARMNTPAEPEGNWSWRARDEDFRNDRNGRLRELAELTGRWRSEPSAS